MNLIERAEIAAGFSMAQAAAALKFAHREIDETQRLIAAAMENGRSYENVQTLLNFAAQHAEAAAKMLRGEG